MKDLNLPDELLSGLQLQKEYIGLQLEEKAVRLLAVTALVLAFLITGTTLLYHWGGSVVAVCFVIICLLGTAITAIYRERAITRIRKGMESRIKASQTLLKHHFIEMTTPPDTVLHLCQAIRTVSDIIREIKNLFKGKG